MGKPLTLNPKPFPAVFSDIFLIFLRFLWILIFFNVFLHGFNGFDWFKWLFEPIRLELDQVSAQMVGSRPESWHFWKLAHGLLGWGTTLRELKVPSGIVPLNKKKIYMFTSNVSLGVFNLGRDVLSYPGPGASARANIYLKDI